MPRPMGESNPDGFEPAHVESIKQGEPVSRYGDQLSKLDLESLSDNPNVEIEKRLLEGSAERLSEWDIETDLNDVDLRIAGSWEKIADLRNYDLEVENNAVYVPDEEEIVLFAFNSGNFGTSKTHAYSSTVHELKHHGQHQKFDKINPGVRESSTQLINLYLKGGLEDNHKRESRVEKVRSGYKHGEQIAEELDLALDVYDNLRESGLCKDEAMSFMLNEYEDRRWLQSNLEDQ